MIFQTNDFAMQAWTAQSGQVFLVDSAHQISIPDADTATIAEARETGLFFEPARLGGSVGLDSGEGV